MRFDDVGINGAALIHTEPFTDDRGSFARIFCAEEFRTAGLEPGVAQTNLSTNHRQGTLRGLHLQRGEAAEAKLVRCIRGALFDVIVDMRTDSPTYLRQVGVELSADNRLALFVPKGCAHGFQTLVDDTDAMYQVSDPYHPGTEDGYRYDDPILAIDWPLPVSVISDKDAGWPLLQEGAR